MTRLNVLGSGLVSVGVLVVVAWLVASGWAAPAVAAAPAEQTKWPPLFPRAGATKVLETDRIIVWDQGGRGQVWQALETKLNRPG